MFNCLVEMISPNKRNPRTPQEEKSRAIRKYRISAMRIGISRAKKNRNAQGTVFDTTLRKAVSSEEKYEKICHGSFDFHIIEKRIL